MKSSFQLHIAACSYSEEDLLNSVSFSIEKENEYAGKVLTYAREWLSGQSSFTFHTSGSTGEPKAIQHSREAIVYSIESTAKALSLIEGDSALLNLHVDMTGGRMMLYRALHLGLKLTVVPPSGNPFAFNTNNFDFLSFVPLQLQQLLENENELNRLNLAKAIIIGGAPVSDGLLNSLENITAPVYATYGMTETISHIALQKLNGNDKERYFHVLPGIKVSLDARGCLCIATPFVTLTTNDLATLHDDTHFSIQGRADQIINSGGFKINPFKTEALIETTMREAGIQEYFLAGLPHETLGQLLVLFVLSAIADTEQLTEQLKVIIPTGYYRPKKIIPLDNFIHTPSGKIDRLKIVQQYLKHHA